MKSLKPILLSAAVALISAFAFVDSAAFTLIKQNAQQFGVSIRVRPHVAPPFRHWDLREFPVCDIPYSFRNGTADMAGTTEFDAVDAAFTSWTSVTPARIAFHRVLPVAGFDCPYHKDEHNSISWNTFDCAANQGDDTCIPGGGCACFAAVAANADIIDPGTDEWLQSFPNNCCDDGGGIIGVAPNDTLGILDNGNAQSESPVLGDDIVVLGASVACGGAVTANGLIVAVMRGPNGVFDTQIQSCCDDNVYYNGVAGEWRVRDGGNALVTTSPNDVTNFTGGTLGLAGVYWNITTGRILEADIMFNDVGVTWHNGVNSPNFDVEGVAAHEIGHCIGLQHPLVPDPAAPDGADGVTPTMHAFVGPAFNGNTFNRTLHNDDIDGCNFLYTPDLGDAPDPGTNLYPSLVHSGFPGRMLNGEQLEEPYFGAEHIFGRKTRLPARNYTYEWIGDDADSECESEQVDIDPFDDGVVLHPVPAQRGFGFAVDVRINTAADAAGNRHDYATTPMYLNIWADWNGNGIWEAGPPEQLAGPGDAIQQAGLYTRGGIVPVFAVDPVWIRVRLDWGEDVGAAANHDMTLAGPEGAAQFGEVQDYVVPVVYGQQRWDLGDIDPCNYPTLEDNPAHLLTNCVWLGGCITPEGAPNFYDLDPCDDGVAFLGLPWDPCTPVTIAVIVTNGPACSPTDIFYFNFWKDGNLDRDFCDVSCGGAAPEWCVVNAPVFAAGSPWFFTFIDPGGYNFPPYGLTSRARLSLEPLVPTLGPVGPCPDTVCWYAPSISEVGEVEDYILDDQQLPVELLSFAATPGDEKVTLHWTTASESNLDRFSLSRDGTLITEMPAHNVEQNSDYQFVDEALENGREYLYTLAVTDIDGASETIGSLSAAPQPGQATIAEFALHQNYPNPFNPTTEITFDLLEATHSELTIYNLMGQEIARLVNATLPAGRHVLTWHADSRPSGVYFYRLTTPQFTAQKKMLLIK